MLRSISRFSCLLAWPLALASSASWGQGELAVEAPPRPRSIQVIELPPVGTWLPGSARQRAHHALSFATDAPKPWLRAIGLDASECSMHLRLPSKISQSREAASGVRFDMQLQAGLGCKF